MDGRAFHGRAVIAVQYQGAVSALFAQHGALNDMGAVDHVFRFKDFVAHNLAAVDIDDQIQIEKLATNLCGQIRHIPTPHSVRMVRTMAAGWPLVPRRCLSTAPALFSRRMQNAVEARFRGQIPLLIIQQPRHDLRRWQACELRLVADIQHRLTLFLGQRMGRGRSYSVGPLILTPTRPASVGVLSDPQFSADAAQAGTVCHGFIDQFHNSTAICGIGHFSLSPQIA